MLNSASCYEIFRRSVSDYHLHNNVDQPVDNPFAEGSTEALLYLKNWIDTVQWHLEDIIRDPAIDPVAALALKRRIDASNQHRTDVVEQIDDRIISLFNTMNVSPEVPLNSETPAWLLDRMSILVLKIWHMEEQTQRTDATAEHRNRCAARLAVLMEQHTDMGRCFDELMSEVAAGRRRIKVYRQMKMYNDASLNPVLYQTKS